MMDLCSTADVQREYIDSCRDARAVIAQNERIARFFDMAFARFIHESLEAGANRIEGIAQAIAIKLIKDDLFSKDDPFTPHEYNKGMNL
jgi:hypothetical protein